MNATTTQEYCSTTSPLLPEDLEREIFEVAAGLGPSTAAALVRVCRRAQIWIEPLLYRTRATHIYHPALNQTEVPLHKFQKHSHHTRHLLFGRHNSDTDTFREYLKRCNGLRSLAIWHNGLDPSLIPFIRMATTVAVTVSCDDGEEREEERSEEQEEWEEVGLLRFSGSLKALFGTPETFTQYVQVHVQSPLAATSSPPNSPYLQVTQSLDHAPVYQSHTQENLGSDRAIRRRSPPWLFQNLTHLQITHACPTWEDWSGLGWLPELTHLAIPYGTLIINLVVGVLKTCKTLKVLVLMSGEPLAELERDGVNEELSGEEDERGGEVEACLWDHDLFWKDGRVVKCYVDDPLMDWYRGAYGGRDFWSVAEEMVNSAKRSVVRPGS